MMSLQTTLRVAAVAAIALALTIVLSTNDRIEAQSRGHTLAGTWSFRALGAVGSYTYTQDGTLSGVSSLIFGTDFSPAPGTLNSSDYGVWRQVGGGFEALIFRMGFNAVTGDVETITRIRTVFTLDPGGESTTGTFFGALWVCPTPITCPDPNVDPPDVPEFAPPTNTWTQTRVRLR